MREKWLSLLCSYPKFTVFSGAGISFDPPSSVPTAADLMKGVFSLFREHKENRPYTKGLFKGKNLRFETFLAVLQDYCDPNLMILKSIGETRVPNPNHFICAQLVELGWHHITCNFDTLIEDAAKLLKINIPTLVYDSDFSNWDGRSTICKIHGSFRDSAERNSFRTMRATISSVGKGGEGFAFEPSRFQYLERTLTDNPLLVIGYSGSDDMDIIPLFLRLSLPHDIIWVWHDESYKNPKLIDEIALAPIPKRIRKLFGLIQDRLSPKAKLRIIIGKTGEILHGLAKELSLKIPKPSGQGHPPLPTTLNIWANNIKLNLAISQGIISELLWFKGNNDLSERLSNILMAKNISDEKDIENVRIRAYFRSAEIAGNCGLYKESFDIFSKLIQMNKSQNPDIFGEAYHSIGNLHVDKGNYDKALSSYRQAIKYFDKSKEKANKGRSIFQIGRILQNRGYPKEALKYCHSSVRLMKRKRMDSTSIAYNLMGAIYWQLNRVDIAKKYFDRSLKINESLDGTERYIATTLRLRSLITTDLVNKGERLSALDDLREALSVYKKDSDQLGIAKTYYAYGRLYEALGDLKDAGEFYRKVIDIASPLGAKKGLAVSHKGLARITRNLVDKMRHYSIANRLFYRLHSNPKHIPHSPNSLDRYLETFF